MGLFLDVLTPAIPVLARLEERGIPLHATCTDACLKSCNSRDTLRKKTQARLDAACEKIIPLAQRYHEQRLARIQIAIDALYQQASDEVAAIPPCENHREYFGRIRRSKSMCCMKHFDDMAPAWAKVREIKARIVKGRNKKDQVGETFDPKNPTHWRFLLFDELGLGLQPTSYTDKMTPQVNEHAFEVLRRRHPDIELLALQVDIQETKTRLTTRLAVEPEADGRVHTPYSIHRTWNLRVSSGSDASEAEEVREGVGNMQNVPKRDRMMYRAEHGKVFIQPDLSQVEARVQAWLAKDIKMLSAWRDGMDIHAMTAAAIYGIERVGDWVEETKRRLVKIAGVMQPIRQMGKKRRHGGNYGMGDSKFADMTGITLRDARHISAADRVEWPRLYEFQKEEIEQASRDGFLRNPFGAMVRFYSWRQRDGKWEITAREEALSFRPASTVGCMIIMMLDPVDEVPGGELLTTTHDSYLSQVDNDRGAIVNYVDAVGKIMSREWPQLGEITLEDVRKYNPNAREGFGLFKCPVDFKVGFNWGDRHVCKPDCQNRRPETPDEPCDDHNPDGLEDLDKWMKQYESEAALRSVTPSSCGASIG